MDVSLKEQIPPDAAPQDQTSEIAKLICKLRWMGMDDEAERLARKLTQRLDDADRVFAAHAETD